MPAAFGRRSTSAVGGPVPSRAARAARTPSRPRAKALPSSPKRYPHPPARASFPVPSRPKATEPVPAMRTTPGRQASAPASATSASLLTPMVCAERSSRATSRSARACGVSLLMPVIPRWAARNSAGRGESWPVAWSSASASAARARSRPPGARMWLLGPPYPTPRTMPSSVATTHVVLVAPPSTPRKRSMGAAHFAPGEPGSCRDPGTSVAVLPPLRAFTPAGLPCLVGALRLPVAVRRALLRGGRGVSVPDRLGRSLVPDLGENAAHERELALHRHLAAVGHGDGLRLQGHGLACPGVKDGLDGRQQLARTRGDLHLLSDHVTVDQRALDDDPVPERVGRRALLAGDASGIGEGLGLRAAGRGHEEARDRHQDPEDPCAVPPETHRHLTSSPLSMPTGGHGGVTSPLDQGAGHGTGDPLAELGDPRPVPAEVDAVGEEHDRETV